MKWLTRAIVFVLAFVLGTLAVSFVWFGGWPHILSSVPGATSVAQVPEVEVPTAVESGAVETSVCDLKNDPARYDHSVVMVRGYFSRGFEDSTLYDPACKSRQWIWVELGGKRSIDVMYCCGFTPKPTREEQLEVEGLKLPLTDDANFENYDKFLAGGSNVKATVIGTFFSGRKTRHAHHGPAYYEGYGHLGIGSLFVVQQVLQVEITKTENRFE
ncbi:MAG TPA: hypothetical protein VMZ26_00315 [Pyrinomonadaceae bacterium]|nr:hypothetical protein [Pyrinomonadaceae bacterium]